MDVSYVRNFPQIPKVSLRATRQACSRTLLALNSLALHHQCLYLHQHQYQQHSNTANGRQRNKSQSKSFIRSFKTIQVSRTKTKLNQTKMSLLVVGSDDIKILDQICSVSCGCLQVRVAVVVSLCSLRPRCNASDSKWRFTFAENSSWCSSYLEADLNERIECKNLHSNRIASHRVSFQSSIWFGR